MKKFFAFILAFVISATSLMPLTAVAAGPNLIANPSMESSANSISPDNWVSNSWGTNKPKFTYLSTGYTGSHSVKAELTSYSSGDAKWYFTPVTAKPNTSYTFSDWYQSSVATSIDVEITTTSNTKKYISIGSPAVSTPWKQASYTFKTPANASKMTVFHYIDKVGQLTIDDASLTETTATAPTPPTISVVSPAANSTVTGTTTITANASDAVAVSKVQFQLDGANLGAADTTAPYSVSWNTSSVTNGVHSLTAIATNSSNLSTASSPVSVTVQNQTPTPTPPTVSISAPSSNATVSGTTAISANANDAQGITSVQFQLDGANLGAADTTAPYSVSWDTKTSPNGTHNLTAIARNTSNLTATSSAVSVTVNNQSTPPTPPVGNNLISNPSVETANGSSPAGWLNGSWGTNTRSLTYETTGNTGTRSIKAQITSYSSGDAKWYFSPVAVSAGKSYSFSNYYKSNIDSELDAMITMSNGTVQYMYLKSVPASPTSWQKSNATFTVPSGAVSVSIFQVFAKVGYVQTDDYSLAEYQPAQFNQGIVSLTFDDGWRSIYSEGLPLLKKYNLPSTQYLLTNTTSYPDYMTVAMMQAFKDQGSEIASHTVSHAHLTQLTQTQLTQELSGSQTSLRNWFGTPGVANNFATPYGEYNTNVINEIKKYYRSHRSTDVGFNTKDSFDVYNIKVQNITNTTTPAQVQAWVNQAIAEKTWLVLVYHEVDASAEDPTYAVTPANLDQELSMIKQSGIAVKTVEQALNELLPQL